MDALRIKRLREAMGAAGLDALFVSNPKNVKYLTGFKTMMPGEVQAFGDPEGFALVHADRIDFLCDGRYIEGARQLDGVEAQQLEAPVNAKSIADKLVGLLPKRADTFGFEQDALLYIDGVELLENLKGLTPKPAEHIFAELRVRKTPDEVSLLRKAQDITCDCFEHIAKFIRIGMTERQVALEIDNYMRTRSEGCSFDSIVAFGQTCCHPHYVPDPDRILEKGHMVLLDFGAVHEGYCGDLTRMLFVGKADDRYREVYKIVLEAQMNCLDAIRPGVTGHDLDMVVRDTFASYDCEDAFLHGTGHGVGLAIHEEPKIKKTFMTKIEPGMVFTDEPGLYYAGWGGIRIEDMIVVTETGHENLTRLSKELIEIDA